MKEQFEAFAQEDGKLVKHGRYRDWAEDGSLWHEIDYKNGRQHGAAITFYPNGRKASETFYTNGTRHGVCTTWNRDGEIVALGTNRLGENWDGTFVDRSRYGVRSPGDEDIRFYVLRYKSGIPDPGAPKEIFDDGEKWKPPPGPINYRRLLRWKRYPYEIDSSYPYLETLPRWLQIPTLLEWIGSNRSDGGIQVAYSQLVALSRADFGHPRHPPAGGLPPEALKYYRDNRNEAWKRWWETVGQAYGRRIDADGRKNLEAWKLVTRDQAVALPDYKIAIPDQWVLRTSFRTGDYDGVQTETLTLRRTESKATLIRAVRKSTRGPLQWEQWQPLTVEQADNFAFAIAYAIDNPWLLKPKEGRTSRKIEGRDLNLYYGGFRYELTDLTGAVWWNDDPTHWHGGEQIDDNFFNAPWNLGPICLLLWRTFPDNSVTNLAMPIAGRWESIKIIDPVMLQQFAEDLELSGEIITALRSTERLSNALEGLAEFGTSEQLAAITRLEAMLPQRLADAAAVLVTDPNNGFRKAQVDRLLISAAKTKTAIQKRETAK